MEVIMKCTLGDKKTVAKLIEHKTKDGKIFIINLYELLETDIYFKSLLGVIGGSCLFFEA